MGRKGIVTIASTVCLAALLLPAVLPLTQAAPVAQVGNGNGPPQQWAYGAQTWKNVTYNGTNYVYDGRAYFGWEVVLTATNTSASTTQLEADRTVGISYFVQYCSPDCGAPKVLGNLSLRAWQHQVEFANLTANATVYENGTAAVALGLSNGSDNLAAGLAEASQVVRNGVVTRAGTLNVARQASAQVSFTPALGLVPWNAATNLSWNSTSTFSASGERQDSYNYTQTLGGQTSSGADQSNATLARTGTESIRGRDVGNVTLRDGETSTGIALVAQGPFDLDDGLFVASHDANLFGGATQNWTIRALGASLASTSRIDLNIDRLHHVGRLLSAAATYSASDQSVGLTGGPTATGSVSTVSPNGTLQAQPETVASAQTAAGCIVNACGTATGTTPGPANRGGVELVAAIVVVGAVGVALVLMTRPKRPQRGSSRSVDGIAPTGAPVPPSQVR
jgi:hypothetical protein